MVRAFRRKTTVSEQEFWEFWGREFPQSEEELKRFRAHDRTGRVLGDEAFQKRLEKKLGRLLRRQKPGRKKAPSQ